ncbi:MAG: tRNA lysidine(34) synthetase TilS [Calditrichaeota bacterium]|nr:tRNA lysidine(34) synthetase TilS [Calditrichota bacterium]
MAVSGGMDSVVLLYLLMKSRQRLKIDPAVVHLHHHIRAGTADMDERLVEELAERHQLTFFSQKYPVKDYAAEHGLSLEEAGHRLRRSLFEMLAKEQGYDRIATGHHRDDQAETILMRIINGTGLQGLAGIRLKSGKWVRPLLFASREEIARYAHDQKILFREDETNRDLSILRNRIRNQLLPLLKKDYNPAVDQHLAHLAGILDEWDTYVSGIVDDCHKNYLNIVSQNKIRVGISFFKQYFSWIRIRLTEVVLGELIEQGFKISYGQFTDFSDWVETGAAGSRFHWSGPVWSVKKNKYIEFLKTEGLADFSEDLALNPGYTLVTPDGHYEITIEPVSRKEIAFSQKKNEEFIAGDRLNFPLKLRKWKKGDRFTPLGMKSGKLVSDYLTDRKIGFPERQGAYVMLNEDEIVAIPGIQISEEYKIRNTSRKFFRLTIKESE